MGLIFIVFLIIEAKFDNIIVNAYLHSDQIVNEVRDFFPTVKVIIEEERLETGGGIVNAIKNGYFKKDKPILLLNADIFWVNEIYNSINKIRKLWNQDKMDMLLCLKNNDNFFGYKGSGSFYFFDLDSDPSLLIYKEQSSLVYTGLQVVKQELFKDSKKKFFSIKEKIIECSNKRKLFGYIDKNPWFHIGTIRDLKEFQRNF